MHRHANQRLFAPRRPDAAAHPRRLARRRAAGQRPRGRGGHPPVGRVAPLAHPARCRVRDRSPRGRAALLLAAPRAFSRARRLGRAVPEAVGGAARSLRPATRTQTESTRGQAQGDGIMTKRRITLERTFAAPIEDVWELWTTREGIESWWGPDGFSVKVLELELRPGGALRYAMTATAPDQVPFMKQACTPLRSSTHARDDEIAEL